MGKVTRKCYYKKSSSSSCNKCSSCSSSSSSSSCKKCCCSSSCDSSAFTIDECRRAMQGGNYRARRCSCSSSSSSEDNSICRSTSATCNPCRYDISEKSCPSSSSSCSSCSSSCCSSSSDCYSSSSSSSCSDSSSEASCDPYYIWGEKPIKKKMCKDGYKCKAYKWKYGYNKCKHGSSYGKCQYNCKPVCCTKQYAQKKYLYNDYDAAKRGKYDNKFGKNTCTPSESSSSLPCPGCPKPKCNSKEKKM